LRQRKSWSVRERTYRFRFADHLTALHGDDAVAAPTDSLVNIF
jgi:hypothetical protein